MRISRVGGLGSAPPAARGVAMMLAAALSSVSMAVCVRLVSEDIHILEIAFFRTLFAFLALSPWLIGPGFRALHTRRLGLHAARAGLNIVAMYLFFYGLLIVPLAEVSALAFTSPLFASVLAVLVLGERITRARALGLAVGFAGAAIVLRPGVGAIGAGGLVVLASCAIWACALMTIKVLARTESSFTIALYAALLQIPLAAVPAMFVWRWPDLGQLGLLALIGVLGGLAHLALAQAFREADATAVLPADFSKLVWASLAGFLLFAELPDLWTLAGGALICGAVFHLARKGAAPAGAPLGPGR